MELSPFRLKCKLETRWKSHHEFVHFHHITLISPSLLRNRARNAAGLMDMMERFVGEQYRMLEPYTTKYISVFIPRNNILK